MVGEEYSTLLPRGQELRGERSRAGSRFPGIASASGPLLALFSLLACSPGAGPPPDLPAELLTVLHSSEVLSRSPEPGLAHYEIQTPEGPWVIHLLRVDLGRCDMGLQILEAPVPSGRGSGRNRVSELLAAGGEDLLAAVNGDFFTPEGNPVGTEVVDGQIRQVRARPAFAWRPGEDPWVGVPRSEGDSILVLGWRVPSPEGDGATEAIGGFPRLLQGGERVGDLQVTDRPSFAAERHPRTALGFDPVQDLLWVMVVDGRQPGYSDGMTLPELTLVLEALDVSEALNLDGGGSTVMVLEGVPVNSPSDADGERPVVNALGISRNGEFCR